MTDSRIVVAGTGPAGLIAALAFDRAGFDTTLVGPPVNRADGRTTAIMLPGLEVLEGIGVLAEIEAQAAPLRTMRILDATSRLVRSPAVTFHAAEIDEQHFGLNVPNAALLDVLDKAVDASPGIRRKPTVVEEWTSADDGVTARLADGSVVLAQLAVAADGRLSPARARAGIRTVGHAYPQSALVLNFAHTRPHGFVSTELHTESGPCTQVPLPGMRSSLVWVLPPKEAARLADLDLATLSGLVEQRMQSMLGKVSVETAPQVYPLSISLPTAFGRDRIALVGEAAHQFPPIGAQGLNLGIRDVDQLVEVATRHREDPGSASALAAYDRLRRPDIVSRTGAVGALNRTMLSDFLPAQMARSAVLGVLRAAPPLRALFMREGLRPGSGLAAFGSALREQVGRKKPGLDRV